MKLNSLYSAKYRISVCCACKGSIVRLHDVPLAPTQRTIIFSISRSANFDPTQPDPTQHDTSKTLVNKCIARTKYFIGLRFPAFHGNGNAFMHLYSHCYQQTVNVFATTNKTCIGNISNWCYVVDMARINNSMF